MPEPKHYDTIIVGARVAGSSLAIQLARAGQKVAVLDRTTFPSDTLSTHVVYPNTLKRMDELGVLDRVLENGPPPLYTAWHYDGQMVVAPHTPIAGRDWAICVRRITLDSILVDQARSDGAEVFEGCQVTGLIGEATDTDPVRGVTASGPEGEFSLTADVVVGADGANSSIARLLGAEKYSVMPSETMQYFAYWKNADVRNTQDFFFEPPWIVTHFPSDNDHHVVSINGPKSERKSIKNLEEFYLSKLESVPALWGRLSRAEKVSQVKGTTRLEGFYRRSTGPGWALTGDAAHFKHPATAQGIGDALHAAEALAPMICSGTYRDEYPQWRHEASRELYAFSKHLAEVPTHASMELMFKSLVHDPDTARRLFDVWSRRSRPWEDVIPNIPGMEATTGTSVEDVLTPIESQDDLRKTA